MNKYTNLVFPYLLCVNPNEYLDLSLAERETQKFSAAIFILTPVDKYLPDMDITDMNAVAQLIADGNLLDQPPVSYDKLKRSVQRMQKYARVVSIDEQIKMQTKTEWIREEQAEKPN
jgi:hypothetical protein